MSRIVSLCLVPWLLGGCASTSQSPKPIARLAGTYVFTTVVSGGAVEGQLRITGAPGDWSATIVSDLTGELPVRTIRIDGNLVDMTADTPRGQVDFRLAFAGDSFTGSWSLGADGGPLRGRRLTP